MTPLLVFDLDLDRDQQALLKQCVAEQLQRIQGQGIKLQHFAARFQYLPNRGPAVHVFFYLTGSGRKMEVLETILRKGNHI
jgi:anaerobic magnesium-protoporphyrin IX monomethyl ester cyclase